MKIRRNGQLIEVPPDYTLKDGEELTTPTSFMDGDTDDEKPRYLHDGIGFPSGFRPGFLVASPIRDAEALAKVQDAAALEYEKRRARLASAWKTRDAS